MQKQSFIGTIALMTLFIFAASCATAPKGKTGDGTNTQVDSPVTGSAGGAIAINQPADLMRCERSLGTLKLGEENTTTFYRYRERYGLVSSANVLRVFAQQSDCFTVVERGAEMENLWVERSLEDEGELRQNSNFGKGLIVAADYTLTPELLFYDPSAQQKSGGFLGVVGLVIGGGEKKRKYKEAQVLLNIFDNRSGVQVLVSEGRAKGFDEEVLIGLAEVSFGGGYFSEKRRTLKDKIIIGAYLDAYNNLVMAAKNYKPQKSAGPHGHGTGGALKVE